MCLVELIFVALQIRSNQITSPFQLRFHVPLLFRHVINSFVSFCVLLTTWRQILSACIVEGLPSFDQLPEGFYRLL